VRVDLEEADFIVREDFPIPPAALWDCMLKPEYRNIFNSSTKTGYAGLKLGRVVTGSEFHCYHGKRLTRQTVVDWHPFDYYTSEDSTSMILMNGMKTVYTIYFVSDGENTRIQLALGSPTHTNLFMQTLLNLMWKNGMGKMFFQEISKGLKNLKTRIIEDLAVGQIVPAVLSHVE
jgi:hypothetical protein